MSDKKEYDESDYCANFLWPHDDDSIEEAGYEFANGGTEAYRKLWWDILRNRIVERGALVTQEGE